MKNIVVVCLDYCYALKIGKQLSNILNMQHIDFDEIIKNGLINSLDYPLSISNEIMQIKEKSILEELADMENVIISLTDDEFISNENYMLFDNSFVILLEVGYKNNIKENIQKLIKKHCNYSVDVKKIKINSLVKVIN